eukprot:TRINITY_DN32765_c0_g1_i1.p1 TRINITY_DN32765_c0_g1~~TRINITY_DN32765_c0_g1_i1.p1  ORF type:complete len:297 (-),score=24.48 TRINITY_DN32765_c0_g1_i1:224-1114(-)
MATPFLRFDCAWTLYFIYGAAGFFVLCMCADIFTVLRGSSGPASSATLPIATGHTTLLELDERCFLCYRWRGRLVAAKTTAKIRAAVGFCLLLMTLATILMRVLSIGLWYGVAKQFCYLTQWGIMSSSTYFLAAWLVHLRSQVSEEGCQQQLGLRPRRILMRLQTISLCLEVTIFVMWLSLGMDANIHQHVLAPGLIVADFALSRLPVKLRLLPVLLAWLLLYGLVNYVTTTCWFTVYPGIDYDGVETFLYIGATVLVALVSLASFARIRSLQLQPRSLAAFLGADTEVALTSANA